jgi:outer membrane protein TolC
LLGKVGHHHGYWIAAGMVRFATLTCSPVLLPWLLGFTAPAAAQQGVPPQPQAQQAGQLAAEGREVASAPQEPRIPVDAEAERNGSDVRLLSLADALRIGRLHNAALRAAALRPERARLDIVTAEASFDPEVYASANYGESESPQRNAFSPSLSRTSMSGALGWRQRVATGGLFDLAFRPARFETTGSTAFPDKQFTAEWAASYRQPLLAGAWTDYNLAPVEAARFGFAQARTDFEQTVQDTLLRIVESYWDLVYARENWLVLESALAVAQEQLRITDARIAVQELAPRDRIADQAEVARRKEELIVAENTIRSREDALRSLLYEGDDAGIWKLNLRPSSEIAFDGSTPLPDLDPCIDRALGERPELRSRRSAIAAAEVSLLQAQRDVWPALDLVTAWSSDGVRDGFDPAFRDATEWEYPDWSIGLEFSLPIGNRAAKARRTQQKLEVERQQRDLQAAVLRVTTEVRDALRNLASLRQSVAASAESVQLAESNLDTERAKLRVGASTNFEVQRRIQELSEARQRHLRNLLDYRVAESRLAYVQGVLEAPQPEATK